MTNANGRSVAVDEIEDRLDRPVHPSYPLRDREIVGVWRRRCVESLHHLAVRGVLDELDALGQPLVQHLCAVADGPMHPQFEDAPGRTILLGELIRNIEQPGRITQGLKGTCAATCVEVYVAERAPAEYARLCAGLMSVSGRVKMRSGDELVRDEDVLPPSAREFRRSPVSRIFQVACMEFAYPDLDYRNHEDGQFKDGQNTGTGLSIGAFDRLLAAISGKKWETVSDGYARMAALFARFGVDVSKVPNLQRDARGIIEKSTRAGEPVFATLELPKVRSPVRRAAGVDEIHQAAHKIRVIGLDQKDGMVIYDDPMDPQQTWFQGVETHIVDKYGRCKMSMEDFEKLVVEMSFRPDVVRAQEAAAPVEGAAHAEPAQA